MSRKVQAVLCALLLFAVSCVCSCKRYIDRPVGEWYSTDPDIRFTVLTATPTSTGIDCLGEYIENGEKREIWIQFDGWGYGFSINDVNVNYSNSHVEYKEYFYGKYKVKKNKIYYTVLPKWAEETGINEIIFERIEEKSTSCD